MTLAVPKAPKRITRPRDELDDFLSSDLEVSFASSMSLNSPPRLTLPSPNKPLVAPSPVPMDISPLPPQRGFGHNLLNTISSLSPSDNPFKPSSRTTAPSNPRSRSALPSAWMPSPSAPEDVVEMEVDHPSALSAQKPLIPEPPPVHSRKRRSTEPEPEENAAHLSQEETASTSHVRPNKFERFASSGAIYKVPDGPDVKRVRRPVLSAILPSSASENKPQSSYPIMSSEQDARKVSAPPPPRRAFSAVVPSSLAPQFCPDISLSSSDDSFVHSSPAADYAKRQDQRVLRRRDGTEEFRPKNGATAVQLLAISQANANPMPPFGHEAHGKILPCSSVREDGLMRITSETLASLLRGEYTVNIASFCIFDCRFDYEYNGGHIAGAVNIASPSAIENLLLKPNGLRPEPSSSGDGAANKTIIIFHCEFSQHRAPIIAKHLRSKDRAANNHIYPKMFYPEVYILSGGYAKFFADFPEFCEPRAYVHMNDPAYATKGEDNLETFAQNRKNKWGRTRSYTYGEGGSNRSRPTLQGLAPSLTKPQRNTAPGGVGSMYAAANAARSRRIGAIDAGGTEVLATLDEHEADTSSSAHDHGLDDSPCPPGNTSRASIGFLKRTLF